MDDIIIIIVVAVILAVAIGYIIKQKKSGAKCIGCPYAKECSSKKSEAGCSCGCDGDSKNE